jgi:hypothetical protein
MNASVKLTEGFKLKAHFIIALVAILPAATTAQQTPATHEMLL